MLKISGTNINESGRISQSPLNLLLAIALISTLKAINTTKVIALKKLNNPFLGGFYYFQKTLLEADKKYIQKNVTHITFNGLKEETNLLKLFKCLMRPTCTQHFEKPFSNGSPGIN